MNKHISINLYEFSSRRIIELQELIKELKLERLQTKGFFARRRVTKKLRKAYREQNMHGDNVLLYEQQNLIN